MQFSSWLQCYSLIIYLSFTFYSLLLDIIIIFIVLPTIQPLQNKTITEGGNLSLPCNASGTPLPIFSWVTISSGQRFDGSVLQLTNINRNQAGDHRCEASNDCGTKSSTATIYVKCKCILSYTRTVEPCHTVTNNNSLHCSLHH